MSQTYQRNLLQLRPRPLIGTQHVPSQESNITKRPSATVARKQPTLSLPRTMKQCSLSSKLFFAPPLPTLNGNRGLQGVPSVVSGSRLDTRKAYKVHLS